MRNFDEIIDVEAIPKAIEKQVPVEEVDRIPGKIAVVAFSIMRQTVQDESCATTDSAVKQGSPICPDASPKCRSPC